MRILHTSDWHLGHRLHEQAQAEEQHLFLNWLIEHINESKIDLLLIAGDIFDTGVPSTQSQKMYYDFLIQLRGTACSHVIITGGNHDAPGTINAPKALLEALSVHVVGKATDDIEDELFKIEINEESVIVAAVPYLRDQDIRKAVSGEDFDEINQRYKAALTKHYQMAADAYNQKYANEPLIAMGHLFAIGGSSSDSEQTIYVGNLGDIGADDFPTDFDYIALGHLHQAQIVEKKDHIRYSGSPIPLSFSEINQTKKVVEIEIEQQKISKIQTVDIPLFRTFNRVTGSLDECILQLQYLASKEQALTPWAEVIIDDPKHQHQAFLGIQKASTNLAIEVLKVSLLGSEDRKGLEQLSDQAKHIKELSPLEVFQLKCKEQDFDLKENPEILDAFNEAWQMANNN